MSKYHVIVFLAVVLASLAQILLKWSANDKHAQAWADYLNVKVIGGYALLAVSFLLNIFAMSKGVLVKEVSTLETLSYLLVPLLSWMAFSERLSQRKVWAIICIVLGVIVFFQK